MKAARTQWFRCVDHQPVHIGWYEVKYHGATISPNRQYWTGKCWRYDVKGAMSSFGNNPRIWPGDSWRGLVERVT